MTTLPAVTPLWPYRLPTRAEVRLMLMQPRVLIVGIVAVTLVVLALIAGVVVLAYNGRSTEALTVTIAGPLIGLLVAQGARLRSLDAKVTALQQGATSDQG